MKHLLILLSLLSYLPLLAQDSTQTDCQQKTITYVSSSRPYHKYGSVYLMGGQVISRQQLSDQLNLFPESAKEYQRFQKSAKTAKLSFLIGVPLVIAGGITYSQQKNASTGVAIGGAIGLAYVIQLPGFAYFKHRKRAISIYNQKICRQ